MFTIVHYLAFCISNFHKYLPTTFVFLTFDFRRHRCRYSYNTPSIPNQTHHTPCLKSMRVFFIQGMCLVWGWGNNKKTIINETEIIFFFDSWRASKFQFRKGQLLHRCLDKRRLVKIWYTYHNSHKNLDEQRQDLILIKKMSRNLACQPKKKL